MKSLRTPMMEVAMASGKVNFMIGCKVEVIAKNMDLPTKIKTGRTISSNLIAKLMAKRTNIVKTMANLLSLFIARDLIW